jgi:hypothetical protein
MQEITCGPFKTFVLKLPPMPLPITIASHWCSVASCLVNAIKIEKSNGLNNNSDRELDYTPTFLQDFITFLLFSNQWSQEQPRVLSKGVFPFNRALFGCEETSLDVITQENG